MNLKKTIVNTGLGVIASIVYINSAFAGGVYVPEMSDPSGIGYGGAGMTIRSSDATTVLNNPAGMVMFDKSTFFAGLTPLYLHAPFKPDENNTVSGPNGDTTGFLAGGNFSYIYSYSDDIKFGVSLHNNYGLALDWQSDWVGRYVAVETWAIAPQLQPTIAYRINDWISVGAGAMFTAGYFKDKLKIDKPLTDEDGSIKLEDWDFAVQGNFGIYLQPSDDLTIGLRYLTSMDLDFKDKAKINNLPLLEEAQNNSQASGIKVGFNLPQSIMGDIKYQVSDKWAVIASFGWEDWSTYSTVDFGVSDTEISTQVKADFRDTRHYGLATEYQYSSTLQLNAGFSYDSSMGYAERTPMLLPLAASNRYGLGFKYKKSEDLTYGGGLSVLYEGTVPTQASSGGLTGQVSGNYEDAYLVFLSFFVQWR